MGSHYPSRIVCLTEETTETLYLLGEGDRVVGISGYTVRPPEARAEAEGLGVHQRALRQDRSAATRPHPRVLRSAGRHRRRADPPRAHGRHVQSAQHRRDPADDSDGRRARRLRRSRGRARRFARARARRRSARRPRALDRRPRVFFEEWDEPAHLGHPLGRRAGRDRRRRPALSGAAQRRPGEEPDRVRRTRSRRAIPK